MMTSKYVKFKMTRIISVILTVLFISTIAQGHGLNKAEISHSNPSDLKNDVDILYEFLSLADLAVEALQEEPELYDSSEKKSNLRAYYQHFIDSYAVRALAVAYDLTGRERYLNACQTWSDRMLRYQKEMIPGGAYYMGYHRKPGESAGQWFVADCGSIAMGILSTAIRCTDETERKRYVDSASSYAELVIKHFVRESGGITDGHWEKSDKEWWCSTALFTAFAFQMYEFTEKEIYKSVAFDAVDWLLRFEYNQTILYPFETGAPTTIFYILEAYAAGLPYFKSGSKRQKEVFSRFSQVVEWIIRNQNSDSWWDYNPDNWGIKLNGFPCHLLIYLRDVHDTTRRQFKTISHSGELVSFENLVSNSTNRAFKYMTERGFKKPNFTQQGAFAMMSYAEKLCPGELYQKTSREFPYKQYSEQELSRILSKRQSRK